MNKITEYLNNLDTKNFVMLIISVIILSFIVVYYLNDYFSSEEKLLSKKKIELIKKIDKVKKGNLQISKLKQKNKLLKTKLVNLQKDLRYLLSEIDSSEVLNVDNKKFLFILHNFIQSGANVNASFKIKENKSLEKYKFNITGRTSVAKFFDLATFMKTIQFQKAIININEFNVIKKNNYINYDMNVSIWSFQ